MEFMVKTQDGNLICGKSFEKITIMHSDGSEKYGIKSSGIMAFRCETAERRDEVFKKLETWLRSMLLMERTAIPSMSEKMAKEYIDIMIFEFPKE